MLEMASPFMGDFFSDMAKKKDDTIKRELSAREWLEITAFWLKGESAESICKKFPNTTITVSKIKTRMKRDGITWRREDIATQVKEKICEEIVDEKVEFTKKIIRLYDDSLEVINNIIQNYKDECMLNPTKPRATAYNMDQLAGALNKCQNGIRTALGMDKDGNLSETEPEILTIEGIDVDKI